MSVLTMFDRVRETSVTSGTGTITLGGAVTGYQSFASTVGNGNQTYYCISDQSGVNFEIGIGTYTSSGSTLSRTTVLASSSGSSLVSFGANIKDVFVTAPASILNLIGTVSGVITVPNGGTGDSALTAYAVLCGGTTSTAAVQSVASVGTSGQVLTSNGAGALPTFQAPAASVANPSLFVGTVAVTIANTAAETTLLGSGVGSLTPPAGSIAAGYSMRIKACGTWSSLGVAAGTITINLYGNGTLIATTGAVTVPLSLSNDYWEVEAVVTVDSTAATGVVWTQGRFFSEAATAGLSSLFGMTNTTYAGKAVLNGAFNLTATWSTASASNVIVCTNAYVGVGA